MLLEDFLYLCVKLQLVNGFSMKRMFNCLVKETLSVTLQKTDPYFTNEVK